jgi:hypothetical protein
MGTEEMHTGFLRERNHLEDRGVDGTVILQWFFTKWDEGMYWIDLAQNRYEWQALVNGVMNN